MVSPIGPQARTPVSPTHRAQKQPFGSSCAVNNGNTASSAGTSISDKKNERNDEEIAKSDFNDTGVSRKGNDQEYCGKGDFMTYFDFWLC